MFLNLHKNKKFMDQETKTGIYLGSSGIVFILIIIILCMWGCPRYAVYRQTKEGQAELAQAQYSKEVAVAQAKAKMESASYEAQADTIRAHGIAASNLIIGNSLTPQYLQWLWVNNLEKQDKSVIYVPSQNGIPLFLNANPK